MVVGIWEPPARNILFACNNNEHFFQILPLAHHVIKYKNLEMLEPTDVCVKEKYHPTQRNAPQQY